MTEHSLKTKSCLLLGLIIPFLFLASLVAIFFINNRPPNIAIPTPKLPRDNGWDDFVKAAKLIRHPKYLGPYSDPNKRPDQWTKTELEAFVRDNQAPLSLVRRGLGKPYVHPHVDSYEASAQIIPSYAMFRELARILAGEAKYYEIIGEYGNAADSCLDCMEFGITIPRGGSLITGMVGSSIELTGTAHLEPLLANLEPDDLTQLAKRMERILSKRVSYSEIVLSEGREVAAMHAAAVRAPGFLSDTGNPRNWFECGIVWPAPKSKVKRVWYNARYAFASKAVAIRECESYFKAVATEQRGFYTGRSQVRMPRNIAARVGISTVIEVSKARADFARGEAHLTILQTEVALRRYFLDHGRCPDRLTALVSKYLKSEPIDPFGLGKPLKYRGLDGSKKFLLYSLGPNLKDDGGMAGKWSGGSTPGDLVAGKL